jgi:hypothetical protein
MPGCREKLVFADVPAVFWVTCMPYLKAKRSNIQSCYFGQHGQSYKRRINST